MTDDPEQILDSALWKFVLYKMAPILGTKQVDKSSEVMPAPKPTEEVSSPESEQNEETKKDLSSSQKLAVICSTVNKFFLILSFLFLTVFTMSTMIVLVTKTED